MSFDGPSLFVGCLVGGVGFVAFTYGRRQRRPPQIVAGILLMVFPYFVPSALATGIIGAGIVGLMALAVRLGL